MNLDTYCEKCKKLTEKYVGTMNETYAIECRIYGYVTVEMIPPNERCKAKEE